MRRGEAGRIGGEGGSALERGGVGSGGGQMEGRALRGGRRGDQKREVSEWGSEAVHGRRWGAAGGWR